MINLNKDKIVIAIIILIIAIVIGYYFITEINKDEEIIENDSVSQEIVYEEEEENDEIIIHITGSIMNSGIIKTKENARISDVIELAGGLTEDADISKVNLAYKVEDGQKIYIPSVNDEQEQYIISSNGGEIGEDDEIRIVNINNAKQTELETLPGIGPSTALRIIKYREENGKFKSIEEIKNVQGIGESKFEQLKVYISI